MKKGKWSPVKEILFTYLAVNKIMYWFNTVAAMDQADFGNVSQAVIMRLINQDLLLIIGVVAFYILNKQIELQKSKYSGVLEYIIFYAAGYVILMGIVFAYNLAMNLIFLPESFHFGGFVREFISFLPSVTIGYIVVAFALEVKMYFKAKEKKASADAMPAQSTEDKESK